jgi:hypothetical protein
MRGGRARTAVRAALCAGLAVLVVASAGSAAVKLGIGRMSIAPNRVTAGTTGNELTLSYIADSAPLTGTILVDVPRGWTKPQTGSPTGPGYVEVQALGCVGTRIAGVATRRIVIDAHCPRRHLFKLLYHRAEAPQIAADGYVFLTQTRKAAAPKGTPFLPLGPRKQAAVKIRGAGQAGLFLAATSVATVGTPFSALVRAVDQFGNNSNDYVGTVTFASSDPAATLPTPFVFAAANIGQHTFTGLVLRTRGTQTLTLTDSNGYTVTSGPITVNAAG